MNSDFAYPGSRVRATVVSVVLIAAIAAGVTAGFIALLLHGIVDSTIWSTRMAFLTWALMGLVSAVFLLPAARD